MSFTAGQRTMTLQSVFSELFFVVARRLFWRWKIAFGGKHAEAVWRGPTKIDWCEQLRQMLYWLLHSMFATNESSLVTLSVLLASRVRSLPQYTWQAKWPSCLPLTKFVRVTFGKNCWLAESSPAQHASFQRQHGTARTNSCFLLCNTFSAELAVSNSNWIFSGRNWCRDAELENIGMPVIEFSEKLLETLLKKALKEKTSCFDFQKNSGDYANFWEKINIFCPFFRHLWYLLILEVFFITFFGWVIFLDVIELILK